MKKLPLALACAVFLFLTGCSETQTTTKKEAEKPPEPATGESAVYKIFQVARSWGGPETKVLKMNSARLQDVPAGPVGTAPMWEATMISESKSAARTYTYSIVEQLPLIHKGVFGQGEQSWSGPRGGNTPFLIAAVKIDTDKAYQIALDNGGADYDKKNPGKPILYVLEKIAKFPDPVWRVVWGETVGTSNFSVYIDASTGDFKEKLH
jgi:hypothetical protein